MGKDDCQYRRLSVKITHSVHKVVCTISEHEKTTTMGHNSK